MRTLLARSSSTRIAAVLALTVVAATYPLVTSTATGPAPPGPQTPADFEAYLEDARMTGEGQQPHHAILRPFEDASTAGADPRAETPYTQSLDGTWSFAYADRPEDAPDGFWADGYDVSDWDEIDVPSVWQQEGYDRPIYRNVPSEIAPYDPPRVPDDVNPSGSYVRSFDVPEAWDDRRTLLRFEGVTSGYFVWVNGEYVGYDQGGMTPAEFDVTDAAHVGSNTVAVRAYRWGSGAYLENFDMWHLSGMFRSVWAYSVPATRTQDVTIRTHPLRRDCASSPSSRIEIARLHHAGGEDAQFRRECWGVSARVEVATDADGTTGEHELRTTVLDPEGDRVGTGTGPVDVDDSGGAATVTATVEDPLQWTDEMPNLYTLVVELVGPDGEVTHVTSDTFGFREITVRGKQIRVNGTPVDFRGVNRHEHDPQTGRHVPREQMLEDVLIMKRNNVNAVRTSHYPNDPAWYDLADEYGLWLNDEVDVETHWREDCSRPAGDPEDCLADRPEYQAAMLDRFTAMMERDKNHPSIFMWSTGNEAGLGEAHFSMAEYAKQADPTRLLYHQSNWPDGDAPYADVWGPRYPSPDRLKEIAAETDRPVVMGEWLHAMGNSLGHYEDMWRTIRREPALQGGFVWDWVEQGLERPLVTTPDSSGHDIAAFLAGAPGIVEGHDGGQAPNDRALSLSGLDDWVEVYRDKRLDIVDDTLTVDAWVRAPATYEGDFSIVSKGDHAYALEMQDPDTIEFFIHDGGWRTVTAEVPADWADQWHRVTGTYDGEALRLYVDGEELASTPHAGDVDWTEWPVNIGRNAEKHGDWWPGRTGVGDVDDVRIYDRALTPEELSGGADPSDEALLALDFDDFDERGTYLAYGSSPFLLNGVVSADRTQQPELAQMKYSHAWIRFADVTPHTRAGVDGRVRMTNDYRFTDTSDVAIRWRLTQGGRTLTKGVEEPVLEPGESTVLDLDLPPVRGKTERWLELDAVLTEDTRWADVGHVLATEQLAAGGSKPPVPPEPPARGRLRVDSEGDRIELAGKDFSYVFDRSDGTFTRMRADGRDLIERGPRLDVWRAPIGNEWANWGEAEGRRFWALGLDRLETSVEGVTVERTGPRTARIVADIRSESPSQPGQGFAERYVYDVNSVGTVRIRQRVEAYGDQLRDLPWLPRVGIAVEMPEEYATFAWYGRGPGESYPDRKNAEHVGLWSGDVDDQAFDYLPPQDTGNKTDTAWAAVLDGWSGLLAVGADLDVSVDRYARERDRANYPFLLRDDGVVTFRIDKGVTGVGDTPIPTQPQYRVRPDVVHHHTVVLRPVSPGDRSLVARR